MIEPHYLSVGDLLNRAYNLLRVMPGANELAFSTGKIPRPEIADDSDHHRTRKGYLRYDTAFVLPVGQRFWALALGTSCGDYPCERFAGDIAAVPLITPMNEVTANIVGRQLQEGVYFQNSMIIGMSAGTIGCVVHTRNRFGDAVIRLLPINEMKATDAVVDEEVLSLSNLDPVVKSPVSYRREAPKMMADAIVSILAQAR